MVAGEIGRRAYLSLAASAGGGLAVRAWGTPGSGPPRVPQVRGAVYLPRGAFTHYQTWQSYDPAVTERDMRYAGSLGLDALRVIVGYEFWRDAPRAFRAAFDHLLAAAARHGLRVLPVLFESVGDPPTMARLTDTDVRTATAVQSPGGAVIGDQSRWAGPRRFTEWFTEHYGDRVVALEVMNEPCGWEPRVEFCRSMLRAARRANDRVPLTMGCKRLESNDKFADPALDIHQFHYNDPSDADAMAAALDEAAAWDAPVWLTEWQRTKEEPPVVTAPNYASLAPTVRASDVAGDFFWQLMLKPAYAKIPRRNGRFNGVFHPDGAVYAAADAHALAAGSDDQMRQFRERRQSPYPSR